MKRITRYFIEGLIFLAPIMASIYLVYFIFIKIDRLYHFPFPGIGFALTISVIIGIGFLVSNFLTRKISGIIDRVFTRLPLVKMIYSSVKDLIGAFMGDKQGFNKPVLVCIMPERDIHVIGFMTAESLKNFGMDDFVAVHLPQTFNYAGNLIIVPKALVKPVNAGSSDVMAFIVSGGISVKEE